MGVGARGGVRWEQGPDGGQGVARLEWGQMEGCGWQMGVGPDGVGWGQMGVGVKPNGSKGLDGTRMWPDGNGGQMSGHRGRQEQGPDAHQQGCRWEQGQMGRV